jgi:hypothetical protein
VGRSIQQYQGNIGELLIAGASLLVMSHNGW